MLEIRYPSILRRFGIRDGSGGRGKYNGGNGVIRELEFRTELSVSMLSERRVYRPYGLNGGMPGVAGLNLYVHRDRAADGTETERVINIGGKMELIAKPGERIIIHTPGGGGWGTPSPEEGDEKNRMVLPPLRATVSGRHLGLFQEGVCMHLRWLQNLHNRYRKLRDVFIQVLP